MKASNYAPIHNSIMSIYAITSGAAFVIFCFTYSGVALGVFVGFLLAFLIVAIMGVCGIRRVGAVTVSGTHDPGPKLYRYEIERLGYKDATVIAANADTDSLDSQTVHFTDPDGNAIAIYSHVLKVVGRQEAE